jgi:hypothetical protein
LRKEIRIPITGVVVIASAIAALLVVGLYISPALSRPSSSSNEGLPIGGVGYITVYNSQGQVVETWHGHNYVTGYAINDMAYCLAGVANPGPKFQGCTGFTTGMELSGGGAFPYQTVPATVSVALVGSGGQASACTTNCNGWTLTATFPSSAFSTCVSACAVIQVIGTQGTSFDYSPQFDIIGPPGLAVQAGDSLQVTIVYTVT